MGTPNYFHSFTSDISLIEPPKKFTYPFYYEPHLLCQIAAQQTQTYLKTQTEWEHPFTQNETTKAIGKMFGVLVVKTKNNELGFISAFSGKLAGTNNHSYFIPPVFDMLSDNSYFLASEIELNRINKTLSELTTNTTYLQNKKRHQDTLLLSKTAIAELRHKMIEAKKKRKEKRKKAINWTKTERTELLTKLAKESILAKTKLKYTLDYWEDKIKHLTNEISNYEHQIHHLKKERKEKSNALQHYLFKQYQFLNSKGDSQDLLTLFKPTLYQIPPAGAGECAAPKLLQYAFANQLSPICMAEFWWGDSPKSEIRKHGHYYPACQGKCKPILTHMLKGLTIDTNPLLKNPAVGKNLDIVFDDDFLCVVNKPEEFLSVPGKTIDDSVYTRMRQKFPNATGPIIVHRLDMSTSGLMVIAKTKEAHKNLQQQFIKRTIQKKYVALLDGIPNKKEDFIDLPLRLNLDDRPRQLVCEEHGKSARTKWEKISCKNNITRVHFYPITGRTHQLRVHAAHQLGLNTPIIGDDLYGKKGNRLCLHATSITFTHPVNKQTIHLEVPPNF